MNQGKKLPKKFWHKTFIEAVKLNVGNISATCRSVGITPASYYNYRLKDKEFAEKVDNIKENYALPMLIDMGVSRAMRESDRLLMFFLRNLGRSKWNRDKEYEAFAKDAPRKERDSGYRKTEDEQRQPTEAELYATKVYIEALEEFEERGKESK